VIAPIEISKNGGAGVRVMAGSVHLDTVNSGNTGRTRIANNGNGACATWSAKANEPIKTQEGCELSGITASLDVTGTAFDVVDNRGDGIRGERKVDISHATVCGNSGTSIVSPDIHVDAVDLCGAPVPTNTPPAATKKSGGCSTTAPGDAAPLALLMLLTAILRFRSRPGAP